MKKTCKMMSIILSVFMLIQMMGSMVSAENLAPTNIHWATEKDLYWQVDVSQWIIWDFVDNYDNYLIYIYKDGELVETWMSERDEQYNFGYESIKETMEQYGTGSYTVKVATFDGTREDYFNYDPDEEIPVLGISEASVPYEYVGEAKVHPEETATETVAPTENSSNNTAPAAESAKPAESSMWTKAEGAEIECPLAVKVCYDLGIMPDVYEDADKYITAEAFSSIFYNLTGESYSERKADGNYTLLQAYTAIANYTLASARYGDALYGATVSKYNLGISIDPKATITHAQLAKVIYNALNGDEYEADSWTVDGPQFNASDCTVPNGLLFDLGLVKYVGDVTVSGDVATVSGKLYDKENIDGTDVTGVELNISDKDLKSGSDYILFVEDNTIISAVPKAEANGEKITKDLTPPTILTLTIGDVNATVNGKSVANDVAPMVANNRTMLPIRFVAENLGATVTWNDSKKEVFIKSDKTEISVVIGKSEAEVTTLTNRIDFTQRDKETVALDSPAFISNGRTYLPVRFVSEKLGADVQWDNTTKTVTITKK